jgi:hypothetical protein
MINVSFLKLFFALEALKISNDTSAAKSVRKQRKLSYQQSLKKQQDIEARLNNLKHLQSKQRRKLPRIDQQVQLPFPFGFPTTQEELFFASC